MMLILILWPAYSFAVSPTIPLTDTEKQFLSDHPTIRLGVGVAFPPYMWVESKKGRQPVFKGMVSDYVDILARRLGVDMKVVFNIPFDEALARGRSGEIDFFPCISNTPERSKFLSFTAPYISYPMVIITRENSPIIDNINDLAGKRVAVVKHLFVYSTLLRDYDHLKLNYRDSRTIDENLEAVSLGNADACIVNLAAASYYIQQKGLTNLRIAAPIDWKGLNLSMGVRKDWPIFRTIIEKALSSITQEERDSISQRWIKVRFNPGVDMGLVWKWGIGIGFGVAVLFALLFVWNRRLKKEIYEKEKAELALKQSQRQLTTLMGNLPGIAYRCINDEDWSMLYLSDGCHTLTGYHPHDLTSKQGKTWNDLIVSQDRQMVWEIVQKAVDNCRPFTIEYRIKDRDGNEKWVWEKGIPQPEDENGRVVLEGFINDISDRKQGEYEREALESQLRHAHKMEAIGTLAGGIAHEFNNLLGIILGNAELAIDDVRENQTTEESLQEIKTASLRGRRVVKQLLSFSHPGEHRKQVVNMADILNEAMGFLRASISSRIQLQHTIAKDCSPVMADTTQIHQVIINLCSNAAQAMDADGGTIDIDLVNVHISQQQIFADQILIPGDYLKLSVSDSGCGITDDVLKKVFHPFYTTKEVNEGTGMGLAVAYGIVKGHNGFISIQSNPGIGTKISCFFPLADTDFTRDPETDEQLPSGNESILFVDDEAALASMGKKRLERLGYKVITCTDPGEAVDLFWENPKGFDLVITDYSMPQMTGDQLIRKLKSIRPDIRTIITSGYDQTVDNNDKGADSYLMKPVDASDMATMVRTVLDTKK